MQEEQPSSSTALIIGSTGKVGHVVVDHLVSKYPHVKVLAASRGSSSSKGEEGVATTTSPTKLFGLPPESQSSSVEMVHLDLDDASTVKKVIGNHDIDTILLITGYTVDMMKQSKRVIDEAKAKGTVKHMVHIGASANPNTAEVAHWGWHQMIEAYIVRQGFDYYTFLNPEAFLQNLTAFGWLDLGPPRKTLTSLIGDSPWSWVDTRDVGELAAEAIARPDAFRNQTWRLGYTAATMQDVAAALTKELQMEVEVQYESADDFYEKAISMGGADPAYMACIRDQFKLCAEGKIEGIADTFDAKAFEEAVGRPPISLNQYIKNEKTMMLASVVEASSA